MKVARDRSPTCAADNVVVVCASLAHECTRERNAAAVHRWCAGRCEPPACLRATAARAAPCPPRPRHAPPAPAGSTHSPRHTPQRHSPHAHARFSHHTLATATAEPRSRPLRAHAPREYRCVRCQEMCRASAGQGTHRGAGGWSCALRHASVSPVSCVLPHPSICRDGPRRPSQSRATDPRRLTRPYTVMPIRSIFSQYSRTH